MTSLTSYLYAIHIEFRYIDNNVIEKQAEILAQQSKLRYNLNHTKKIFQPRNTEWHIDTL